MKVIFRLPSAPFLALAASLGSLSAQTAIEWSGATDSAWATSTNWAGAAAPADDLTTNLASFNLAAYPNQPNAGTRSVAGLAIGDTSAALTISGTSLTLGASGITKSAASNTLSTISTATVLGVAQTWNNASTTGGLTVSGVVSGAADAGLTKAGAGTLTLSGANTYNGGTTVSAGTLGVGNNAALGTGAITLAGGSLQSAGGTLRTLANTSVVATASTTTSLAAASGDLTLSGALTGSGTISVNNAAAGSAWLSGNLSGFTGTLSHTNVNGGNNFFVSGGADLSGAKVVLSGATTSNRRMGANSAGNVSIGELSGTGGILGAGNNAATTYTIGALNTSSTYNGTVINVGSGVASIIKTGSGSLTLGGANTYTGSTTINGGAIRLGVSEVFGNTAMILGGGTLDLNAFSDTVGTLTINTASIIDFGATPGVNSISFANSSAIAWLGTVTLQNFEFGVDILKFGTSATALTATQLNQISLAGYTATGLDSTGVVQFTAVPEPSVVILFGAGMLVLFIFRRRFSTGV